MYSKRKSSIILPEKTTDVNLKRGLTRHSLFWSAYLTFLWVFVLLQDPGRPDFIVFILKHAVLILAFYINILLVFPLQSRLNSKFIFALYFLNHFAFYCVLKLLLTNVFLPFIGKDLYIESNVKDFLGTNTYLFLMYSFYALFYWNSQRSIRTQNLLRITEKARLEAEFNHLRTQINPHFLFNTLNTFYSQSLMALPDTAKGIALLSKIMRYSLNPPGKDGKVPLKDEIAHANDYIELMQIRLPGKLQVTNNLPTETDEGWQILPHVLITLVENAFKHGSREHPFLFDLQLANGTISFRVENTIGEPPVEKSSGVGLRNLKERLQLIYGKNCTFEEGPQGNRYSSKLVIQQAFVLPEKNEPANKTPVPLFS